MLDTLLVLLIVDIFIGFILVIYVLRKYFAQSSKHYGAKNITDGDKILFITWLITAGILVVTTIVTLFL